MIKFLFILAIWQSNEPWKAALTMNDKYYLPVPPIFAIVNPENSEYTKPILVDLLSANKSKDKNILRTNFSAKQILYDLNNKINPQKSKDDLVNFCYNENISQACLILGRIYEFGSFNESENLNLSYSYYNRVLKLNDSSANSPLAFFRRHIFPNLQLSLVEDDYSSNYIESVLSKSLQLEMGFARPISCNRVSKELILVSQVLVDMFLVQPNTVFKKFDRKFAVDAPQNLELAWKLYRKAVFYLKRPYPTDREIKRAKILLNKALGNGCSEAVPLLAKLHLESLQFPENEVNIKNEVKTKSEKIQNNEKEIKQNNENEDENNKSNEKEININNADEKNQSNENGIKQNNEDEIKQNNEDEKNQSNENEINLNNANEMIQDYDYGYEMNYEDEFEFLGPDVDYFSKQFKLDVSHPMHPSELLSIIEPYIDIGDSESILIASSFYMRSSPAFAFKPHFSATVLHSIYASDYPPVLHRLADLVYFGLMQMKRSANNAFSIYMRASACGHNPSSLAAAKQLVGGDGVCADCPSAVSLLRSIVDSGPWSHFYDLYIKEKRSKVAFLRMVEMGLTPPIWIDDLNFSKSEVNISSSNYTKMLLDIQYLPAAFRNNKFLDRIRKARNGDAKSIVWLALNSNISDSLRWIEKLQSLPIDSYCLSIALRTLIVLKGMFCYRNLMEIDRTFLYMMISPFFNDCLLILITILIVFFTAMKINYVLS